jgi:peptide/nickel transport system substrate-binding protein
MYTLQFVGVTDPDILRLVYHSQQVPPTGLNRVRYKNPDVDRLIEEASAASDEEQRRELYRQTQRRIAEDVPYVALWYKTNVAIFQPDIHGVTLSPIADFTFLRGVYRQPAGSSPGS